MDYSRRELANRLASEYVLGTLRGPARRRFDALLPAHPALRDAVAHWRRRLESLAASVAPVTPPDRVWQIIETRLFASAARSTAAGPETGWWRRLTLWRSLTAVATAASVAMVIVSSQVPPPQAPIIVVLGANPDAAQILEARFVASVSADGRALVLRPLNVVTLAADRALELWAVPPSGAPRSLGIVGARGVTTLLRTQLLQDTAAFAVSVEPPGGSPTGAPTGPIVSVGQLQI